MHANFQIRTFSLLLRRLQARQECKRILQSFAQWREVQRDLQVPRPSPGTLLVIRLDDIGDFLLFRNQLATLKASPRWQHHSITLLGNSSWKEIFDEFDRGSVNAVQWVNKAEYLSCAAYRLRVWRQLREQGFATVLAPARTRPLLLDDLCRLAAAPTLAIGASNTYVHSRWNQLSDGFYHELFTAPHPRAHEFAFNGEFSTWSCGLRYAGTRPFLNVAVGAPAPDAHIVCFVGANTRSRRWPVKRWIEFINLYRRRHPDNVLIAGSGSAEVTIAAAIETATGAQSIAGKVSLIELLHLTASARAVLTNDTMAAHLGVSCGRPTVIIANGVNYQRFTDYAVAGIDAVATIYPAVFEKKRRRSATLSYGYTDALTADIATIRAHVVYDRLQPMLAPNDGH